MLAHNGTCLIFDQSNVDNTCCFSCTVSEVLNCVRPSRNYIRPAIQSMASKLPFVKVSFLYKYYTFISFIPFPSNHRTIQIQITLEANLNKLSNDGRCTQDEARQRKVRQGSQEEAAERGIQDRKDDSRGY